MGIKGYLEDGIAILSLSGKLLGGDLSTQFQDRIHGFLDQEQNRIIVDLARVEYANSQGIGMLIAGLTAVRKKDARLVLANITNIQTLLAITRLLQVFDCYDSIEEAKEALQKE